MKQLWVQYGGFDQSSRRRRFVIGFGQSKLFQAGYAHDSQTIIGYTYSFAILLTLQNFVFISEKKNWNKFNRLALFILVLN